MKRCIRYIVHQRVAGEPRKVGLFSAAYWLLEEDALGRHDRARLYALLRWFEVELTVPPHGAIPRRAIFWYRNAGPFSGRMWELAHVIDEHGFTPELVTACSVGRIVYEDTHQIAAIPCRRRRC